MIDTQRPIAHFLGFTALLRHGDAIDGRDWCSSLAMLCARPDFACHAIAKAPLDGKPLSAALAFVKTIVPLVPLALTLFSSISRAAC